MDGWMDHSEWVGIKMDGWMDHGGWVRIRIDGWMDHGGWLRSRMDEWIGCYNVRIDEHWGVVEIRFST